MPKIDKLFAFVAEDKGPDDEGIMGMKMPDGSWLPFVGADQKRIESLLPMAQMISKIAEKPFRILEFSVRKDVTGDYDR